jgi:acyl-CoA thioesterase
MKTIEEIREFFAKDRFATDANAYIEEVGDCYAKCSMKLSEHHKNAVGGVMGGVHFTLADFTFAVATNWQKAGVVSLSSTITYLSPVKGDELIAEAFCVKEGRNTNCYRIDIHDNLMNYVATVNITGYRKA